MSKALIVAVIVIVGFFGVVVYVKTAKREPQVGTPAADQGSQHIARGQTHEPYKSEMPTSGPHYSDSEAPTTWGIHKTELPDETLIHNMEHGGVIIAYRPDLPKDQIQKIEQLFGPPYSNNNFKPIKAIVIPRYKNKFPIEMGAWTYNLNLQKYDEKLLIAFYQQRLGKSPEPTGQ